MVADREVLVAEGYMDSDGQYCVCLAPRDTAAEDFLDMARDEKLANRSVVYRDPSMLFYRATHGGTKSVHLDQTHSASQRKGAADRNQEPTRVYHHPSCTQANGTCL